MADVQIYGSTPSGFWVGGNPKIIWVSVSIGYVFYNHDHSATRSTEGGTIYYKKTTDGGATWGTEVRFLRVGNDDVMGFFSVWYDRETPGDTGTIIHVAASNWEDNSTAYKNLDTSDDSLSSDSIVVAANSAGDDYDPGAYSNQQISITKARGSNLYIWVQSFWGGGRVYRSIDDGASWTERASPTEGLQGDIHNEPDRAQLMPAGDTDANDIACLYFDYDASQLTFKLYDDSGDSWGNETVIGGMTRSGSSTIGNPQTVWSLAVAINPVDNKAWVCWWVNGSDAFPTDLNTAILTLTAAGKNSTDTTTVFSGSEANECCILIDANQPGTAYIGYLKGGTWATQVDVYYKKTTDSMATWGSETKLNDDSDDDWRNLWCQSVIQAGDTGRFEPTWIGAGGANLLYTSAANSISLIPFPYNAVVDDFNRSDGVLNGTGIWASGRIVSGEPDLRITSNQVTKDTANGSNWGSAFTVIDTYSNLLYPFELFVNLASGAGGGNGAVEFDWFDTGTNGSGTLDGYGLYRSDLSIEIYRHDNGSDTQIFSDITYFTTGDSGIGILHDPNGLIHVFENTGNGWVEIGAPVSDSTYHTGAVGMYIRVNGTAYFDDIGFGNVPGISFISDDEVSGYGVSTSQAFTLPTGHTADDLLLATIYADDGDPGTPSETGYTALTTDYDGTGQIGQMALYKKDSGSESNPTFDFSNCGHVGAFSAWRNVHTSSPIDAEGTASFGNATAPSASITTNTPYAMMIAIATDYSAAVMDEPIGWTSITKFAGFSIAYKEKVFAGASGTVAFQTSAVGAWSCKIIALKPASDAGISASGAVLLSLLRAKGYGPRQVIRPDGTTDAGSWTAVGAGSLHAAVNDDSNSSYDELEADSGNSAALHFDGTSDAGATAPNDASLNLEGSDWTIECWAQNIDAQWTAYLIGKGDQSSDANVPYHMYITFGTLVAGYRIGFTPYEINYAPTFNPGSAWNHIAVTYTHSTKVIRTYINGILEDTSSPMAVDNSAAGNTGSLVVGIDHLNGTANTAYGNNSESADDNLDEIRIWSVARTGPEIADYYTKKASGNETGLVACWSCEEGSGTSAANSVAGGDPLTLDTGVSWDTTGLPTTDVNPTMKLDLQTLSTPDVGDGTIIIRAAAFEFPVEIDFVQKWAAGSDDNPADSLAPASDTTAGNLIVVTSNIGETRTITGVTDSAGNTYVKAVATTTAYWASEIWCCFNAMPISSSGGWVRAAYSGAGGTLNSLVVAEYSGLGAGSINATGVNNSDGSSITSLEVTTSSGTPIVGDLVVSCLANAPDDPLIPSAGWNDRGGTSSFRDLEIADKLSSGGAETCTWTWSTSVNVSGCIASFRPA